MTIALLCPTRARHEQFKRMVKSAKATANRDNINIYVGCSEEELHLYIPDCIGSKGGFIFADENGFEMPSDGIFGSIRKFPDGQPTCHKWNRLAEEALKDTANQLFMLAADDMVFSTPCWDQALLDHYNALENKIHVYALRDSRDENGTPHPIVTREYIEAMGYFLPPIFLHWFVDSWTVEIAKANNCFTHMKDYMLIHDKPSDRGEADATHNRIRSMGWHERDTWVNEKCQHFLAVEKTRLKMKMCE